MVKVGTSGFSFPDWVGNIYPADIKKGDGSGCEKVNPLQPYSLVYVRDDGVVRYTFTQPKQILDMYRLLCSGKTIPCEALCRLFDEQTSNGNI